MVTEAADNVGDPAVQARGTLGGALAHSDPAADFTAIFLALNGSVDVTGARGLADDRGRRSLRRSLHDGAGRRTRSSPPSRSRRQRRAAEMAYEKFRHPASGYAVVGVAAVVDRRRRWRRRLGAHRRHRRDEQGDACQQRPKARWSASR